MPMTKTRINIDLPAGKKAFFTSDWHLGWPDWEKSLEREKQIVKWLDTIEPEAGALFLLGDIFDFWFDYRHAAPRHFVRVLGKLASMHDAGIPIYYFYGNHDMWHRDYLSREAGFHIIPDAADIRLNNLKIYAAHGDGLGPGDKKFKAVKYVFRHPVAQWLYRWIHPDIGIPLALYFSRLSRNHTPENITRFMGPEKEHLILHSKSVLQNEFYNYFIYGHRHHVVEFPLSDKTVYFNIGDWIKLFTFAVSDGKSVRLEKFKG